MCLEIPGGANDPLAPPATQALSYLLLTLVTKTGPYKAFLIKHNECILYFPLQFESRYELESRLSNQNTPTRLTQYCSSRHLRLRPSAAFRANWANCLLFFSVFWALCGSLVWRHKLRKREYEMEKYCWELFQFFLIVPQSGKICRPPWVKIFQRGKMLGWPSWCINRDTIFVAANIFISFIGAGVLGM